MTPTKFSPEKINEFQRMMNTFISPFILNDNGMTWITQSDAVISVTVYDRTSGITINHREVTHLVFDKTRFFELCLKPLLLNLIKKLYIDQQH